MNSDKIYTEMVCYENRGRCSNRYQKTANTDKKSVNFEQFWF